MAENQRNWLQKQYHYKKLEERASKIYLTRHHIHLPLLFSVFVRQLEKDNIRERAAAMAFNFTLSIFPFIIFIFTVIPYIPIPDLNDSIMEFLKDIMPP